MVNLSMFLASQTGAEFTEQYQQVLESEANEDINLTRYVTSPFVYAQHCHEAVLALAYALNLTIAGEEGGM